MGLHSTQQVDRDQQQDWPKQFKLFCSIKSKSFDIAHAWKYYQIWSTTTFWDIHPVDHLLLHIKGPCLSSLAQNERDYPHSSNIIFLIGPTRASFSFIFGIFKQTIQFLLQINVKNVHPVYGTWIRTHHLESPPITTIPRFPTHSSNNIITMIQADIQTCLASWTNRFPNRISCTRSSIGSGGQSGFWDSLLPTHCLQRFFY